MKKVLIIGSGGREHALGWKIGESEEVGKDIAYKAIRREDGNDEVEIIA